MRSADKTKAECLAIWNKHKDAIDETIDKAKTKEVDGNTHVCQLKLNIDKLWTNEQKLAYIEKMIKASENAEYEFRFKYQSNEEMKEFICYAKNQQLAQLKYETFLNENVLK